MLAKRSSVAFSAQLIIQRLPTCQGPGPDEYVGGGQSILNVSLTLCYMPTILSHLTRPAIACPQVIPNHNRPSCRRCRVGDRDGLWPVGGIAAEAWRRSSWSSCCWR